MDVSMPLGLSAILADLALALTAALVTLPIAWEREKANRPAGLRTFPVVALASCAFVLIATRAFGDDPQAQARILQGLMTGIGFVGGGAILSDRGREDDGTVTGIATAASIWNTGAIGAAVGYRQFQIAVILSVANFIILRIVEPVREADGVAE